MGIFSRISTIFKSNINDALSKAEDPEKMLNQIMLEMNEQLAKTKQQVAIAIADEKRLEKQYQSEEQQAQEWERKATLAVQKQKQAVDTLKQDLGVLERKIAEAGRKKNLLIARQKRAQAQKQIHETMAGMRDSSAFDTFGRMAEKVDQMEARADAAAEMSEMESDKLEDKFAELEKSNLDDDLASLKAKISGTSGS